MRDASPDAWGRRVIEHKLERSPGDLEEIDYLLNGPQDGAGYLSFGLKLEPPATRRRYNRTHQLADLVAAAKQSKKGNARRIPITPRRHSCPNVFSSRSLRRPKLGYRKARSC